MSESVHNPEVSAVEDEAEVIAAPAPLRAGVQLPAQTHFIYPSPLETVRSLLTIIVMALFALTFILQPFRIPSESMERTLLVGDFLLVNKSIYGPKGIWHTCCPTARYSEETSLSSTFRSIQLNMLSSG